MCTSGALPHAFSRAMWPSGASSFMAQVSPNSEPGPLEKFADLNGGDAHIAPGIGKFQRAVTEPAPVWHAPKELTGKQRGPNRARSSSFSSDSTPPGSPRPALRVQVRLFPPARRMPPRCGPLTKSEEALDPVKPALSPDSGPSNRSLFKDKFRILTPQTSCSTSFVSELPSTGTFTPQCSYERFSSRTADSELPPDDMLGAPSPHAAVRVQVRLYPKGDDKHPTAASTDSPRSTASIDDTPSCSEPSDIEGCELDEGDDPEKIEVGMAKPASTVEAKDCFQVKVTRAAPVIPPVPLHLVPRKKFHGPIYTKPKKRQDDSSSGFSDSDEDSLDAAVSPLKFRSSPAAPGAPSELRSQSKFLRQISPCSQGSAASKHSSATYHSNQSASSWPSKDRTGRSSRSLLEQMQSAARATTRPNSAGTSKRSRESSFRRGWFGRQRQPKGASRS